LNGIEVIFFEDNKVIDAWRGFIGHATTPYPEKGTEAAGMDWNDKLTDHLNSILHEMGQVLSYPFDPMTLKRNAYYPKGWGQVEFENILLRKALLEVMGGSRPLKMEITNPVVVVETVTQLNAPQELGTRNLPEGVTPQLPAPDKS
jgi:hypothetical protein